MAKKKILVIEDDEDIQELLKYNLTKEGYQYLGTTSGSKGLQQAKLKQPDLIILDIMLPDLDGLEVCKKLKKEEKTENIPVIMLTAKSEEMDIVMGLELGAEDYITKPFLPRVLIAIIRVNLRRDAYKKEARSSEIKIHNIVIQPQRHVALVAGQPLDLTITEFKLLSFLIKKPGWVFSRQQIIDSIQGEDYAVTDRAVDVQILGLRRKLGSAGKYIETVRGVGYRFKE